MSKVIKNSDFKLVAKMRKPDTKKRLSFGRAMDAAAYDIYRNSLGQIVLDPVKAVPVHEMWLFGNKNALASVNRGLADSAAGRTKHLGSFAPRAAQWTEMQGSASPS